MNAAGQDGMWTGAQLAAHLATLDGVAPAAACHVVHRVTRLPNGRQTSVYECPDEARPIDPDSWPRWLTRRQLRGVQQLRVAVLVIRESVDAAGRVLQCTLERRLGDADGPFHGDPAKVEFIGPAEVVRWYRAGPDGRLVPAALSSPALPHPARGAEPLAGEVQALEARFGPGLSILDMRDPTLFEEAAGFDSIAHVSLRDGSEHACGIGWFGTTPFVLEAEFPRFGAAPALPPQDEAALRQALPRLRLVRYETRRDAQGLAVLARQSGAEALFLLRVDGGKVAATPYQPLPVAPADEDQRRWLRYIETHEGLVPLDHYGDGDTGNLIVLTGDAGGHVWRHCIDPDGVEVWRRPADDSAAAALHREHLLPGTLAQGDAGLPDRRADDPIRPEPDTEAASSSLLGVARLYQTALTTLHAARDLAMVASARSAFPDQLVTHLHALQPVLESLPVERAIGLLAGLHAETKTGMPNMDRLVRDLSRLEATLQEELALVHLVPLQPAQWRRLNDDAPFGAEVEARFPGCAYDIEEAASCLAFRRPTAAAFHCMKVVERGLVTLGQHLGLPGFPGRLRGWNGIMQTLRPVCPDSCAPVLMQLEALRRRWHAPSLTPAEKYTEAEAEMIFQSVGGFMRELAAQCDEANSVAGDARLAPTGQRLR